MPTISASEALQNVTESNDGGAIPLGLRDLDRLLSDIDLRSGADDQSSGGLPRGEATELVGPPGAGKTALCTHAAVAALRQGGHVLWIDTATKLATTRLERLLDEKDTKSELDRLTHVTTPTLPHLLALILHPPKGFLTTGTSLMVLDSLSALIDNAYPRGVDDHRARNGNDNSRWLSGRRQSVINTVGSRLAKLAAVNNIAILVVSGTVTQIRVDTEAVLKPALTGSGWETTINRQIYLYRDWLVHSSEHEAARVAMNLGSATNTSDDLSRTSVAFKITDQGIEELEVDLSAAASLQAAGAPVLSKRKRSQDGTENTDGEEDSSCEYGWDEGDEIAAEGLVVGTFL